jgi:hypothetical protein
MLAMTNLHSDASIVRFAGAGRLVRHASTRPELTQPDDRVRPDGSPAGRARPHDAYTSSLNSVAAMKNQSGCRAGLVELIDRRGMLAAATDHQLGASTPPPPRAPDFPFPGAGQIGHRKTCSVGNAGRAHEAERLRMQGPTRNW